MLGKWSLSKVFVYSFQETLDTESSFKYKIIAGGKVNVVLKEKVFCSLGLHVCQHFRLLNLFLI